MPGAPLKSGPAKGREPESDIATLVGLLAVRATAVSPVVPVHGVQHVRVDVKAGGADHPLNEPPLGRLRSAAARQCHAASSWQRGDGTKDVGAYVHTPRVLKVGSNSSTVLDLVALQATRHAGVVDTVSRGQAS